jgi:DHA1 family bicyclomycin/chloramphenicol resistance-like MFS transporter
MSLDDPHRLARPGPGRAEFVALVAMHFALVALSIDAMLPALDEIAAELTPERTNRAQLILTALIFGMGAGTLFSGPLSDALGRRPVILGGTALYACGAALSWVAPTLETMLLARLIQGLGVAGPRIAVVALIRDLYKGREMARIMSFAMMIFTLVPAAAPLAGQTIMGVFGWRSIFVAFVVFAGVAATWMALRQPETLPPAARNPLSLTGLAAGARQVLAHPVVRIAVLAQTLVFGALFASLSTVQPLFTATYGLGEAFPLWFALMALIAGSASLVNARLVMRLGMRRMVTVTLGVQAGLSLAMVALLVLGSWGPAGPFALVFLWLASVFFMAGVTIGNLTALALEPMGAVAGLAASLTSAIATMGSTLVAGPVGLAFDGTPLPLAAGVAAMTVAGLALMRLMPRG